MARWMALHVVSIGFIYIASEQLQGRSEILTLDTESITRLLDKYDDSNE